MTVAAERTQYSRGYVAHDDAMACDGCQAILLHQEAITGNGIIELCDGCAEQIARAWAARETRVAPAPTD